ncbi:hypothetical protein [Frankia sp. KB5]|uniref:hypothetical protein n=1 Tax=Frankia sp. KB5 TaxID=683318 RepID=UPI000A100D77|nr:hypothetical protein [Frankia sp. KB5]ORT48498.1 hypothetical protein KBI5_15465 [Frankia sp. KB5]
MPATASTPDPRLDSLPSKIRDRAAKLLGSHMSNTRAVRDELLGPDKPKLRAVTYSDGTRTVGPAAREALTRAAGWWHEAMTLAEQLVGLTDDHAQAGILAAVAGDEDRGVLRDGGRGGFRTDRFRGEGAEDDRPNAEDRGQLVAGTRIPITGMVAVPPPPPAPKITVTVGSGADPGDVAAFLRKMATKIESDGAF